MRVRRQHSPLSLLYITMILSVRRKFFEITTFPKTIYLNNIVVVLRRSPATVEHQDRHHAVVLTELLPEALLDRSPGCVIELYVCQELGGAVVSVLDRSGREDV